MGYIGKKMSENAENAYNLGEKPFSKWEKQDFLKLFDGELKKQISKLTLNELKSKFLKYASWHHTSSFYNKTEFYEIDQKKVDEFTIDEINTIITKRTKTQKEDIFFITAKIEYVEFVGTSARFKHPETKTSCVKFMSNQKQIVVDKYNNTVKRLTSIVFIEKIERVDTFASFLELQTLTEAERQKFEKTEKIEQFTKQHENATILARNCGYSEFYKFILDSEKYKNFDYFVRKKRKEEQERQREQHCQVLENLQKLVDSFNNYNIPTDQIKTFLNTKSVYGCPKLQSFRDRNKLDDKALIIFFKEVLQNG